MFRSNAQKVGRGGSRLGRRGLLCKGTPWGNAGVGAHTPPLCGTQWPKATPFGSDDQEGPGAGAQ